MVVDDLIFRLMTDAELATSRVGFFGAVDTHFRLASVTAETVTIDRGTTVTTPPSPTPACELVVVEVGSDLRCLTAASDRLTRDGMLVATMNSNLVDDAFRTLLADGLEWVALLDAGFSRYHLVAGMGFHPSELDPVVAAHMRRESVAPCVPVPQSRQDRTRRRRVRRDGRKRMLALAGRLREEEGSSVDRVILGIEILVGERPSKPHPSGSRPGMFALPGLPAEPWPSREQWPNLARALAICELHAREVQSELAGLMASGPLVHYIQNSYNEQKFQIGQVGGWKSIPLYDEVTSKDDIPLSCPSTRALCSALSADLSGEMAVLRLEPRTSLQPHYDDNDYQQAVHLALRIPTDCGIRVAGESRTWVEGEAMVFAPAFLHEAWNSSDRPRDILLIDTWHPDLTQTEIASLKKVRNELMFLRHERESR